MKRFTPLLFILALASISYAGIRANLYTVDATNGRPTSATQGIPLSVNDVPVKTVNGAISAFAGVLPDGGVVADADIKGGNLIAWCYHPEFKRSDGGSEWSRCPGLDIIVDAGSSYAIGVMGSVDSTIYGGNGRLYYQTTGVLVADGGTPPAAHNVFIQGRY